MNTTEAIEILEQYKQAEGFPHMLEALQDIDQRYDELNPVVQMAFNIFMRLGRKMFSPVEEV
jgi:hypothetical protein